MSVSSVLLLLTACAATPVPAQEEEWVWNEQITFAEDCEEWDDWDKPADPFRVFGNTYYVGTCGIAALAITTDEGLVLLDSGTEAGARIVERNIARSGLNVRDIRLLGYSHEHFDHVGGMAYLQDLSGASLISLAAGAEAMRTGNSDPADPQHGMHDPFAPVRVDFIHEDGGTMALGSTQLTSYSTPGHTPGATTWQWQSCEGDLCRTIVYADSLSAVSSDDYRFSDHPEYLRAYRDGIARLAALDCDILLTPHPSASGMRRKIMADDLTSGMDCAAYAADRLARLEERLAQEAAQ